MLVCLAQRAEIDAPPACTSTYSCTNASAATAQSCLTAGRGGGNADDALSSRSRDATYRAICRVTIVDAGGRQRLIAIVSGATSLYTSRGPARSRGGERRRYFTKITISRSGSNYGSSARTSTTNHC